MAHGFEIIPPRDAEGAAYEAEVTELMKDPVVRLLARTWESQRPAGIDYSSLGTGGPNGHMAQDFMSISVTSYRQLSAALDHEPRTLRFAAAIPDAVARLASAMAGQDGIDAILAGLGGGG